MMVIQSWTWSCIGSDINTAWRGCRLSSGTGTGSADRPYDRAYVNLHPWVAGPCALWEKTLKKLDYSVLSPFCMLYCIIVSFLY